MNFIEKELIELNHLRGKTKRLTSDEIVKRIHKIEKENPDGENLNKKDDLIIRYVGSVIFADSCNEILTLKEERILKKLVEEKKKIKVFNNTVSKRLLSVEKKNFDKNTLQSYHNLETEKIMLKFTDIIFNSIKLDNTTHRLLLLIIERFTQQVKHHEDDLNILCKKGKVKIDIIDYMKMFDIKDTKDNRKTSKRQFKSLVNTLMNLKIIFKDVKIQVPTRKKNGERIHKNNIIQRKTFLHVFQKCELVEKATKTTAEFLFSNDLMLSLTHSNIIELPKQIYTLNIQKYKLAFKLLYQLHFLQNQHTKHDCINLKVLIDNLENWIDEDRNYTFMYIKQQVIEPLTKNLDYLKENDLLIDYHFRNLEQLKRFDDIENVYLEFTLNQ